MGKGCGKGCGGDMAKLMVLEGTCKVVCISEGAEQASMMVVCMPCAVLLANKLTSKMALGN